MKTMNKRPIFLNLTKIHFAVAAVVSLLHRLSGVLLSLLSPVFIYLFGLSIQDEPSFLSVVNLLTSLPGKLIMTFLVWILAHHFFAGIRFLFMDVDVGLSKTSTAHSAWWVHIGAGGTAALALGYML
jgi:succinate dehydrogenase / fumarate reductase cytochrome b subunit